MDIVKAVKGIVDKKDYLDQVAEKLEDNQKAITIFLKDAEDGGESLNIQSLTPMTLSEFIGIMETTKMMAFDELLYSDDEEEVE